MRPTIIFFIFYFCILSFIFFQFGCVSKQTVSKQTKNNKEIFLQLGHASTINSINYSPSCKYIVSGSSDQTIKLFEISTGKLLRTFVNYSGVNSVKFSPNKEIIVSSSNEDNKVKLWDIKTGKVIKTFNNGHNPIFSPDGRLICFASNDKKIKLLDIKSEKIIKTYDSLYSSSSLSFSPDSKFIAFTQPNNCILLWDIQNEMIITKFIGHLESVNKIIFSPNGQTIASGSDDKSIKVWDTLTGNIIRSYENHKNNVEEVMFSKDGHSIISGSSDSIQQWDIRTGKMFKSFTKHANDFAKRFSFSQKHANDFAKRIAFSPDGQYVATAFSKKLKIWDMNTEEIIQVFSGINNNISLSTKISPDKKYIAFITSNNEVYFWNKFKGQFTGKIILPSIPKFKLIDNRTNIYSVNNEYIITSNTSKSYNHGYKTDFQLWNIKTNTLIRNYYGRLVDGKILKITKNRQIIISGETDDTVWDLEIEKKVNTQAFESIDISQNGMYIVSDGVNHTVKLWNALTGDLIRTFKGHKYPIKNVCLTLDDSYILSKDIRNNVLLWDLNSKIVNLWDIKNKGQRVRINANNSIYRNSFYEDSVYRDLCYKQTTNCTKWSDSEDYRLKNKINIPGTNLYLCFLPNSDWIMYNANSLFYESSQNGDKYAALRFNNDTYNWKPLLDYKNKYKKNTKLKSNIAQQKNSNIGLQQNNFTNKQIYKNNRLSSKKSIINTKTSMMLNEMTYIKDNKNEIFNNKNSGFENAKFFLQRGHLDTVNSLCFSPNGKYIVSGSSDNTLKLWDFESGKVLRTFVGHSRAVSSVAFDHTGKRIVSSSYDSTVKLWDVKSGNLIKTFVGHEKSVNTAIFGAFGQSIVSGSDDCKVILWNVQSGEPIKVLNDHLSSVTSVCFSFDGKFIVSGSKDKTIKVWNPLTGMLLKTFEGHSQKITSVDISSSNQYIVSGSTDKTIKLWNITKKKYKLPVIGLKIDLPDNEKSFVSKNNSIYSVRFIPKTQNIIFISSDNTINIWNLQTGNIDKTFNNFSTNLISLAVHPVNQDIVAIGDSHGTINIINTNDGNTKFYKRFKGIAKSNAYIKSVIFSLDSNEFLTLSNNNAVKLWDSHTGKLNMSLNFEQRIKSNIITAGFFPKKNYIVFGHINNTINVWNIKTKKRIRTFTADNSNLKKIYFSSDGQQIITLSSNDVQVWDIITGKKLKTYRGENQFIQKYIRKYGYFREHFYSGKQNSDGCFRKHFYPGKQNNDSFVLFDPYEQQIAYFDGPICEIQLWGINSDRYINTIKFKHHLVKHHLVANQKFNHRLPRDYGLEIIGLMFVSSDLKFIAHLIT